MLNDTKKFYKAPNIDETRRFYRERAEYELVWYLGNPFPQEIICLLYEHNLLGEKHFVERKIFDLVERKIDKEGKNYE